MFCLKSAITFYFALMSSFLSPAEILDAAFACTSLNQYFVIAFANSSVLAFPFPSLLPPSYSEDSIRDVTNGIR